MSNRLASCGPIARSPDAIGDDQRGRNPSDMASTTLARTQPLGDRPRHNECLHTALGQPGREASAKKADGTCLRYHQFTRLGSKFGHDGAGRRILLEGQHARDFERKRYCGPSRRRRRRCDYARSPIAAAAHAPAIPFVVSIAAAMLPPPKMAGSANPLTKSTISRP